MADRQRTDKTNIVKLDNISIKIYIFYNRASVKFKKYKHKKYLLVYNY
jgi:hypothetical protein